MANLATYLLLWEEILGHFGKLGLLSVYFSVENVPLKWICDIINVQTPKPFSSLRWSLSSKHLLESLLLFKYVTCSVNERVCLWLVNSKLPLGSDGWIWCSWNKALIAWPNNTLNPLRSRHFKLCQIGFGMWTNILEPDSHMHALLPGSKLDTLGNCINSFRPPGNLTLSKRKFSFKTKICHSISSQTQVKGKIEKNWSGVSSAIKYP